MAERVTGTVKWFNASKGFGFLARRWPGRFRALQRDRIRRFPHPPGRPAGRVRNRTGTQGPAGSERQTPVIPQLNQKIPPHSGEEFF